jgi:hypothetical protein
MRRLPARRAFLAMLVRSFGVSAGVIGLSLGVGIAGYHFIGRLGWTDAFLNAAMILTGMGPVDPMRTTAGKLFAGFYALYSGVAFLTVAAILFAPVGRRFLHRFHLELWKDEAEEES